MGLYRVLNEEAIDRFNQVIRSLPLGNIDSVYIVIDTSLDGPLSVLLENPVDLSAGETSSINFAAVVAASKQSQSQPQPFSKFIVNAINSIKPMYTEVLELNWARINTFQDLGSFSQQQQQSRQQQQQRKDGSYQKQESRTLLLFFTRPAVKSVTQVCEQLKTCPITFTNFFICFVPRMSFVCEQIIIEELSGLKFENRTFAENWHKQHIIEIPIGFIPFDSDVLSLEWGSSLIREVKLNGDSSSLMHCARSILNLQSIYGPISNIRVKGSMSKAILDIMLRLVHETAAVSAQTTANSDKSRQQLFNGSHIDTLIMIDRDVDYVSTLCTPLTYEALIDETFGIRNSICKIDSHILSPDDMDSSTPAKTSILLNSQDPIFVDIRDLSLEGNILMKQLNERALKLKAQNEEVQRAQEARDIERMNQIVKKIPLMKREEKSLSIHINLAQTLRKVTGEKTFQQQWQAERSMIEGETRIDYIEECIINQVPLVRVLRLLCLQSLTGNGIKVAKYEQLRRDIVHTYGFETLIVLNNLEKLGLLKRNPPGYWNGTMSWPNITKAHKLIVANHSEQGSEANGGVNKPKDISYVTAGYAPLSVRLVQLAMASNGNGWTEKVDTLKIVPGPTICNVNAPGINFIEKREQIHFNSKGTTPSPPPMAHENDDSFLHDTLSSSASSSSSSSTPPALDASKLPPKKKIVLVLYVGGITRVEISSLRFLSRNPELWKLGKEESTPLGKKSAMDQEEKIEIHVATTKILNGTALLNSFIQ